MRAVATTRTIDVRGGVIQVRVRPTTTTGEAEIWPSLGEYPFYDAFLYSRMTHDTVRNAAYERSLNAVAQSRTVLDIGTGQDLVWARAASTAGAARVFAVEALPSAARKARQTLRNMTNGSPIVLLEGTSFSVTLPERADVCVSEVIGSIASAEGAIATLNDARERLLTETAILLPTRCATCVAAVSLPEALVRAPAFPEDALPYLERLFELAGQPFDVRLTLSHVRPDRLASTSGVVELLDFRARIPAAATTHARLRITRDAAVHGLLLWPRVWLDDDADPVDALEQRTSWLPCFVPCFYPGFDTTSGDVVRLAFQRLSPRDEMHPEYALWGIVERRGSPIARFASELPYLGASYRDSPLYCALFVE